MPLCAGGRWDYSTRDTKSRWRQPSQLLSPGNYEAGGHGGLMEVETPAAPGMGLEGLGPRSLPGLGQRVSPASETVLG